MNTNMKISSVALLLAGVTGASVAYAADPITDGFQKDSQAVSVEITGEILNAETTGCVAASSGGLSFDMGNDEGATEWTPTNDKRFTLSRVSGGSIEITCDPNTKTEITFKTNNDFNEDTFGNQRQYGVWPVIIVPSFPEGSQENLAESQVNGYLAALSCDPTTVCTRAGASNLNKATISQENQGAGPQVITADIEGQLYSALPAFGTVQHSPRDGTPALYVIYDGESSSHLPIAAPEPS
jgi:hypothetical protein